MADAIPGRKPGKAGKRVQRLKRESEVSLARWIKKGNAPTLHEYTPTVRPWQFLFTRLLDQDRWWEMEFEKPADMMLSRASEAGQFVQYDAPVNYDSTHCVTFPANVPFSRTAQLGLDHHGEPIPKRPRQQLAIGNGGKGGQGGGEQWVAKERKDKNQHHVIDGAYVKNRSGTRI